MNTRTCGPSVDERAYASPSRVVQGVTVGLKMGCRSTQTEEEAQLKATKFNEWTDVRTGKEQQAYKDDTPKHECSCKKQSRDAL